MITKCSGKAFSFGGGTSALRQCRYQYTLLTLQYAAMFSKKKMEMQCPFS